ncbi:BZ3500_MvSof-1268-A1-R1_Chr3-1g05995 [Microbotryum saponariae]|uniref:BZ3500_MvSof-1268-A1-R1_Chr3-1g05995 protein n=1 Tax=Microbotryum saponariae TaxID=289078 RepID=A0A2X0LK62_9BASI|nr:BZ3500_MvSof-1268-A1-R1_Chr3-1g05995 [Microbotryum saponariae]SDA05185.1 BZ3501_MvSof-1269-A2-R1_Chr3-1g05665 [Microbotryum saponariae]
MFVYHGIHTWTLKLSELASLGSGEQWKTPPFYPLDPGRMALCFDNSGHFRLELLHRADLSSRELRSYDHNLKHFKLRNATCEIWSADRTECYHSHHFVLSVQCDLQLDWNVPRLSQWANLGKNDESFCVVIFRVNSQGDEADSAYRKGIEAQLAKKGATLARIALQECQQEHQATLMRLCSKIQQSDQVIHSTAHPFNVRFAFGSAGDLWESSEFLASQSAYFADLFAAGFSESIMKPVDAEQCSVPTRTVHVIKGRLEEYHAVFVWLRTGLIRFDDSIGNSAQPSDIEATAPCSNAIQASSVYSLSHYLQLPELSALALNFCLEHLTPARAALELLREWCYAHEEVRQKLIEYVVRNWSEVKTSSVITDLCKTIGKDSDLPFEAQNVLLELMAKVAVM